MKRIIFLTGATGFVGQNLCKKILNEDPTAELVVLIRPAHYAKSKSVIERNLKEFELQRIHYITGDIKKRRLGIHPIKYDALSTHVTHIIHAAANTRFDLTLEEARKTNCQGTKNVMLFAQQVYNRGHLQNIAHISTAFVSGNRSGIIYEHDLDNQQKFSNTYEQSKYESEQLIRTHFNHLPVTVFRPSIIVGNSETGITSNFNVLYYPLKLLYKGVLRVIPAWEDVLMDVVPIDYVCDAIYQIVFCGPSSGGRTYHLTAGKEKSIPVGDLTRHAAEIFYKYSEDYRFKVIRFISPVIANLLVHTVFLFAGRLRKVLKIYGPYLTTMRVFDNSTTLAHTSNIELPALSGYLETILKYCLDTDWGKIVPINTC